jgi:hypothetical protein
VSEIGGAAKRAAAAAFLRGERMVDRGDDEVSGSRAIGV